MVVTQGYEQLGVEPGNLQTYLKLAEVKICPSVDPYDYAHVQQKVATDDRPSCCVPQERAQ